MAAQLGMFHYSDNDSIFRIDKKIDAINADLAAHLPDMEGHKR